MDTEDKPEIILKCNIQGHQMELISYVCTEETCQNPVLCNKCIQEFNDGTSQEHQNHKFISFEQFKADKDLKYQEIINYKQQKNIQYAQSKQHLDQRFSNLQQKFTEIINLQSQLLKYIKKYSDTSSQTYEEIFTDDSQIINALKYMRYNDSQMIQNQIILNDKDKIRKSKNKWFTSKAYGNLDYIQQAISELQQFTIQEISNFRQQNEQNTLNQIQKQSFIHPQNKNDISKINGNTCEFNQILISQNPLKNSDNFQNQESFQITQKMEEEKNDKQIPIENMLDMLDNSSHSNIQANNSNLNTGTQNEETKNEISNDLNEVDIQVIQQQDSEIQETKEQKKKKIKEQQADETSRLLDDHDIKQQELLQLNFLYNSKTRRQARQIKNIQQEPKQQLQKNNKKQQNKNQNKELNQKMEEQLLNNQVNQQVGDYKNSEKELNQDIENQNQQQKNKSLKKNIQQNKNIISKRINKNQLNEVLSNINSSRQTKQQQIIQKFIKKTGSQKRGPSVDKIQKKDDFIQILLGGEYQEKENRELQILKEAIDNKVLTTQKYSITDGAIDRLVCKYLYDKKYQQFLHNIPSTDIRSWMIGKRERQIKRLESLKNNPNQLQKTSIKINEVQPKQQNWVRFKDSKELIKPQNSKQEQKELEILFSALDCKQVACQKYNTTNEQINKLALLYFRNNNKKYLDKLKQMQRRKNFEVKPWMKGNTYRQLSMVHALTIDNQQKQKQLQNTKIDVEDSE